MHSFLYRGNALLTFSVTILAVICGLASLSDNFNIPSPTAEIQGSKLDANAKTWRLAADFMNDLGMLMDLISPIFPSAFVIIVCFGSISRSFTGVASGATRAALTQHFSLENNAADISAKIFTTVPNVATGLSFLSLDAANYKAVCSLLLNTLNDERSSILFQHFMETGQAKYLLLKRKGTVDVIIHKESTAADILQSYIHALVVANLPTSRQPSFSESYLWIAKNYSIFMSKLRAAGWNTERLLASAIVYRAHWDYSLSSEDI